MSTQANIVAFDGATTPVSHTFIPIASVGLGQSGWEGSWRDNNAALPIIAAPRITQKFNELKGGIVRCETAVELPVMESVSGQNSAGYTAAPKVAHVIKEAYVTYAHERATPADRRLARQLLINVMGNISTSVAAATTGPASELHDNNICAS